MDQSHKAQLPYKEDEEGDRNKKKGNRYVFYCGMQDGIFIKPTTQSSTKNIAKLGGNPDSLIKK